MANDHMETPVGSLYAFRSVLEFCYCIILIEPPPIETSYRSIVQSIQIPGRPGIKVVILNIVRPTPYLDDNSVPFYVADITGPDSSFCLVPGLVSSSPGVPLYPVLRI